MRIQSDFHDFYDVGMAQGHDDSLVYRRYARTEPTRRYFSVTHPYHRWRYTDERLDYKTYAIGFCGKVYTTLELSLRDQPKGPRKFCYKVEDADSFIKQNFKPALYEDYLRLDKNYDRKNKWYHGESHRSFAHYFEHFEKDHRDIHGEMFLDAHSPIFVWEKGGYQDHNITWDACLKPYEFFRIFDPYTAFQEISMFLGNMAEPRKPIPHIDDETMASIKGFDKFSFRKDKKK